MGSSCVSNSAGSSATGSVSAGTGLRFADCVSELDASRAGSSANLGVTFRNTVGDCFAAWCLNGCTISARPLAPRHGSRGFARVVSTGAGVLPKRPARSDSAVAACPLVTDASLPMGRRAEGGDSEPWAYALGLTDAAFPVLLEVGSPEYSSHLTLLFGATFPPQNFWVTGLTLSRRAGGAFRRTGIALRPAPCRFSSTGDTSRIERNLRGWLESRDRSSGSGELGGETSTPPEYAPPA
jgi:hypothetical protein